MSEAEQVKYKQYLCKISLCKGLYLLQISSPVLVYSISQILQGTRMEDILKLWKYQDN